MNNWPRSIAIIGLSLLAGFGCASEGQVVIQNQTGAQLVGSLDNRGFALAGYERITFTIRIGDRFLVVGPDEKELRLDGESCTRFPFQTTVIVKGGETTNVNVAPDAACVVLENEAECDVDRIFMREQGNTDWGENRLESPLFTGTVTRWRLPPRWYEFLLVDQCGDSTLGEPDAFSPGTIEFVRHVSAP